MSDKTPSQRKSKAPKNGFLNAVGSKEERKLKARKEGEQAAWFGFGMFGLVGWSVAIPTLLGVTAGIWIDKTWPSPYSWTLMFLLFGVIIGCFNAWYWVKRESRKR